VFKTNITVLSPSGENLCLRPDPSSKLVLKRKDQREVVLLNDAVTSFDVICLKDGLMDIFLTTEGGSLFNLTHDKSGTSAKPVMLGKDSKNKICSVRALYINGRYHLFYCLDTKSRYLIHHIFSHDETFEPQVVDTVGKRFVYDIATDDDMNIHIVYASEGGVLKYKKYINSQKVFTDGEKICSCDPRFLRVCLCSDRLFAAYTEYGSGGCNVYFLSAFDYNVKKAVFSVGNNTTLSLNTRGEELFLHLADNGVCYEIKSDLSLNISRGISIGKTYGICGIRFAEYPGKIFSYPVDRDNEPLSGYRDFLPVSTVLKDMPKPKGCEAEEYAQKHKDFFNEKIQELEKEDFSRSMANIEASLAKLVEITEKVFCEIQKNPGEEKMEINKEQMNDE